MKKVLIALRTLTLCAGEFMTPVCAQGAQMSKEEIYQRELAVAVRSGSGTAEDPYKVDYALASDFEQFMIESWNHQNYGSAEKPDNDMTRSGFVGNCLTVYEGKPSAGAVWVYTSGGMSVTSDGNLRIKKVAYNTVDQTHKLAAAANYTSFWPIIHSTLLTYIGNNKTTIAAKLTTALTNAGITSIGGYSASSVALAVAKCAGAGATVYGTAKLAYDILNAVLNISLNNASNNDKTYVHIVYITAYHGEWYEYSVGEAGWKYNKVYTPANTYGIGHYYPN